LLIADFRLSSVTVVENYGFQSAIFNLKSEIKTCNVSVATAVMLAGFFQETTMTPNDFRKLALSHHETEERQHMDHPDFRVGGKIFATLGYPDKTRGMVKLSPEDQHYFSKDYPGTFVPVKGTWGRRGATSVYLKDATKEVLAKAIAAAWRNTAPKRLLSR